MRVSRAYKDMEPTYGELARALKKLHFEDKSTDFYFVYEREDTGSVVLLRLKKENEKVMKEHFASLSYVLEGQGVIEHEYDLGKMIEQAATA